MKLTLEQYLFLLDTDITRGLLSGLSTREKQNEFWGEIGRHEDRMKNYVKDFKCDSFTVVI